MIQLQFLNKLLDTGDSSVLLINNITEDYFSLYPNEFKYIKEHLDTYNKLPDKASFLAKFPNFETIVVNEPFSYLVEALYKDKNSRYIASTFSEVRDKVLSGNIDDAIEMYITAAEQLVQAKHLETIDLLSETESRYIKYVEKCNDFNKYYISTGFKELDAIIGGWDRQEELVTIAARTNQGKTWLMLKFAAAAIEQGLRVGIYSGEMSADKVGARLDTILGNGAISNSAITRGRIEYQNIYKSFLDSLKDRFPNACCKVLTPAMIDGPAGVTALRAFIEKDKLDILFVDQHSLLEDDRKAKNPVEKASNISKDLKNLQVLKKIPIIAVSQQNRSSTENGVGTEHIAQSDRISQDSTIVLFFEQDKEHHLMTLHLVKSRDSVNMKDLQFMIDLDKGLFQYIPEGTNLDELKKEFEENNDTSQLDTTIEDCNNDTPF